MKKSSKSKIQVSLGTRIIKNTISVILILYTFITIFLVGNTVLSSFKPKQELIQNTFGFPKTFTLENYKILLGEEGFGKYFINSLVLVFLALILLIAVSSTVAYGLAQYDFKGRGFLQTYFLVGLMFPIQLGILPLFVMLTKLHLNNNLAGLALLYAANMSFPVFVFSKFFKALPYSLIESSRIDGASEWRTYLNIIIPISKPVFFTIGLINFVTIWNDFYMPLVFLTKSSVRTLTLAVYSYMANFLANWNKVFAAVAIALVPVVIIFFLFSDQIVAGLTGGAVKE